MSAAPQEQQPVEPQATVSSAEANHIIPAKRSATDDEIQFVSSNPVKKRRETEETPAKAMALPPLTSAPRTAIGQHMASQSQTTPADRCRSTGGADQPNGSEPAPDNRGTSLPALENFAFPQSLPPVAGPPRVSEGVSPRQFPQALPSLPGFETNTTQPFPPAPDAHSQNSVGIDQIPCLDFHGVPTNAPGFDVSRIFSADGGIMSGVGMGSNTGMPPFTSLNNPNAIPFTMYSTGNIVPMPQAHCTSQPTTSFTPTPMRSPLRHSGASDPGNARHQHLPGDPHGHNITPSPTPGSKPSCLHCARLRQDAVRQTQGPRLAGDAAHSHHPANYHHDGGRQVPHKPTSNLSTPLPLTHPGPTPRSNPAGGQPANRDRQPPVRFSTPARPNLVFDIAETVQAIFPYAQVAARHGIAPAKVAEVVSGMLMSGSARPPAAG